MWKETLLEFPGITETILYNDDQGLYLWYDDSSAKYYISENLLFPLDVDGTLYYPTGKFFNGQPYYKASISSYLWYADGLGYVITRVVGSAFVEWWSQNGLPIEEEGEYRGDVWYSNGSLIGTYQARGILRGETEGGYEGTPKTVTQGDVVGWESNTLAGIYTASGGETGEKYVGWKRLTANEDLETFIQIPRQVNDKYIFQSAIDDNGYKFDGKAFLWYDGANWIINNTPGTKDPEKGYWQGGIPPTPSSGPVSYSLVYTGSGTPPTPATYQLDFAEYMERNNGSIELYGQVALWL
jgi:hypothetical protein